MRLHRWLKTALAKRSGIAKRASRSRLQVEQLQDRITPASTAFAGGVLTIDYSSASEAITVANAGGNISLSGSTFTGDGGGAFSGVNRIVATDSGGLGGQSLTFGGSNSFVLTEGLSSAGVETVTFNREVNASGGANSIDVTAPQNIVVAANLTGGTAGVHLTGQGLDALSTTGIEVQYILISAAGNGPVTLTGTGGSSGGGGVVVFGTVTSGGGLVSVTGTAGGSASAQTGVALFGTISAGGSGAVTVSGHGNALNNAFNYGVLVNGGTITSSGGNVSVSGESLGRATYVQYGSITAGGAGSVTVSGVSPNSIGIYLATQGFITSNGGPVLATGSGSIGVYVFRGTLTAGAAGSVSVVGNGNAGGSHAIRVDDSTSKITSTGGPIHISTNTASGGNGLSILSGGQLSTTNNASITITSDAFAIGSSPNGLVDAGTGTVTIQPQTPGTRISLGGGDNSGSNPRTLGISVFELGQITAGTLHIGNASAGPIVFDPAYTGGGSGGPPVTLESGEPVVLTTDLSVDIDGSSASLDYSQVTVAGSIDLNGVGLILNGSYFPVAGDSYPIINNTGSAAIINAFAAKPEGTILTFNGSPLRLSYVGGNGNDVVLTHATPVISGVSPAISPDAGGATITLNGTGFTGATSVTVDGVPVAFNLISDTSINFVSPVHAVGAVEIVVVNPTYGSSSTAGSGNDLTYVVHSSVALDGSNDLVIASSASVASANAYAIVRDAANLVITDVFPFAPTSIPGAVLSNGGLTLTIPLASLPGSKVICEGGAGDDSLVVDHSGGAFGKTIAWNGGAPATGPGDSLTIAGNGQGTVTYNYTNAHDGSVILSNFGTIEYTGLEPITNTGTATDIVFNLPAGPNAATLADDGTPGNGLIRLSGATFETTTFANPSGSLTINRGNASDTIAVQFHADFTAPLTLGSASNPFADITLTLPTAPSAATLADDGMVGNGLSHIIGATFVPTKIANPTGSLTIHRGNASDTITIHSMPDFTASLTIGAAGSSFGTATLAQALNTAKNLEIYAGLIAANANVGTMGHQTYNGPVQLSGSRIFVAQAGGDITFASTIDGTATGADELIVNPSNTAAGKVIFLGSSGATTRLGQWSVYSPTETRLGGSVFTDTSGGRNGAIEFGGAPNFVLTASVTLDTESGNAGAGQVGFYGTTVTADAPGFDLTIDSSTGAGFGGGRIVAGGFNNGGGAYVNDLAMNTTGGSGSGDILLYSGAIFLDNNGSDTGDFSIASGSVSTFISGGLTVDTEQGNDGDGGSIDFGTGPISGAAYGIVLDTSTTAAGKLAGNITLPGFNPGDVSSLTIAVNGPTAANAGTVTLTGAIGLAVDSSLAVTARAINLSTAASDLSVSGTGEISLVAFDALTLASGASLATANRAINLTSDQIAIDVSGTPATINAGTAAVTILANTANRPIHLGAADSGSLLGLTDGELDRITAGILRIGNASTGLIQQVAAISPANASTLALTTGANVNWTSGALTVANLVIRSQSDVVLAGANEVQNLAISAGAAGSGLITFNESNGFAVTTVDGLSGLTTPTGAISVVADDLNILQPISTATTVALRQSTTSRPVNLGVETAGSLSLTDAELDRISAATTLIGDGNTGTITIGAAITHANNLTLTTGGGITSTQSITMAVNKNLTATAVNTASFVAVNSNWFATGSGAISLTTQRDVIMYGVLSTVNGNLTVSANQQTTATAGNFIGVFVDGGVIQTTGTGALTVQGRGGNNVAGVQIGVYVSTTGKITGGTGAAVTVVGTGGASTGPNNSGVYVINNLSAIGSTGSNVIVTGVGGGGTTTVGVAVSSSAQISAGGGGTTTVTGTGGTTAGSGNYGVQVAGATISSAGGNVFVTGIAGNTTNEAVRLQSSATISSGGTANVTVTGDSLNIDATSNIRGGASSGGAVFVTTRTAGTLINLGAADVLSGSLSLGLLDAETDRFSGTTITIGSPSSGSATISAAIGHTTTGEFALTTGGNITASSTLTVSSGKITLTANDMAITAAISAGSNRVSLVSNGTRAINLGTNGGATLGLTDTELDLVAAGTTAIGHAAGGAITVSAALTHPNNLTLTTGAGIIVNQSITMGAGRSLTATALGAITLPLSTSDLVASGLGAIALTTAQNVSLQSGASIVTSNGNLTILANQQTKPTSGDFVGVSLVGGLIQATGSGTVTVRGKGGDSSTSSQYGIAVHSSGDIIGGTSGLLTVEGIGGAGSGGDNHGISVLDSGSTITSGGGNVQVTGTGGATGSSASFGVALRSQGRIAAGGSGTVSIAATGGSATGGGNIGLWLNGGGIVTSAGGNVSVVGVGGNVGNSSEGVHINGAGTISAGTGGTVSVQGTGGTGIITNSGIRVWGSSALITSTSGSVDLVAIANNPSEALVIGIGGTVSTGANAALTITTDGLNLLTGVNQGTVSAGTGTVTIQPRTAGTLIDLGGSDVVSGSPLTLGLADDELDRVTAGTLNIGNATSGTLTVSADATRSSATNIALTSNADIVISGAINTGGGTLALAPGATSASVKPLKSGADITASTTSFTSGRDLTINIAGATVDTQYDQLNVAGAVNLANVELLLTGAYVPAFNDTFTIVSATSITGTFNGYANNAVFTINGVTSQITYTATAVMIKSINNPVITGGDPAAYSIGDNITYVAAVAATDVDLPAPTLIFSIAGGADAAKFQINATTGVLSMLAADFEAPTDANSDNIYEVIVQVSDGYLTDTQAISVTVTNVNETPILAQPANDVTRVNTDATGAPTAPGGGSSNARYSSNGRYIVFESTAVNLVPGDTNGSNDIFRKDLQTGAIIRVSTDGANAQVTGASSKAAISADGRYVVFESSASTLVPGDTNGVTDIFRKDLETGAIVRVSVDGANAQVAASSSAANMSADGRYVVFVSSSNALVVGDVNSSTDVFRKDLQTGAVVLVSVSAGGVPANNSSTRPVISADGRYVAFESFASNLIAGDSNGYNDVFRKDLQTGALIRVSVDSAGLQANNLSTFPAISADGRYVAFGSYATNLTADDSNGYADVFRKDLLTGAVVRASLDANGIQANADSGYLTAPVISADGRYVAYDTTATTLVGGDTNGVSDVFRKDLETNAIARISIDNAGQQSNNASNFAAISADGRMVAFRSSATNLVVGDTNGVDDIFAWSDNRISAVASTSLASAVGATAVEGPNGQGNNVSTRPALSADGSFVVFSSLSTNLVAGDTNGAYDIFRRDLQSGAVVRVSANAAGLQGTSNSYNPVVSADGRYVVFYSAATNLVAEDSNGTNDIFRKDLQTGEIVRVSVDAAGAQATGDSFDPVVSADGQYVVFRSNAPNLVAGDTNGTWDLFRKDLETGEIVRVSTDGTNAQANADSYEAAISTDGRYVAFRSHANNLVPGDTNSAPDIFRKDLQTNEIVRVSADGSNGQAFADSYEPSISADGRYVAFRSNSNNLVLGDTNGLGDIFRKDLLTGAIVRASVDASGVQANGSSFLPAISADGRFVAFHTGASNLIAFDPNGYADVYRKDLATGAIVRVGSEVGGGVPFNGGSFDAAISADGRVVAFDSSATNFVTSDLNGTISDVFVWTDSRTISVPENSLAVYDFSTADPDAGQTPTYSIAGGADAALFQIHGTTGVLSFIAPPDYETLADANGDNTYQVFVQASDGTLADTQRILVAVTNANTVFSKVYVDDDWSSLLPGTVIADADSTVSGNQPATIGIDAFASLTAGAEAVASGGTAIVYAGSYAANVSLPTSFSVNVPSGTATFSGAVDGSGGFTKIGTGTLVLTGPNSFTGGLTINRGKVQVFNDAALGAAAGSVAVNAPAELAFMDNTVSSRSFDLNDGNLSVVATKTLTLSGGEILGGVLNGPGAIATTAGAGVLFFSSQAAPGLTINAGGSETFTNFINKGTISLTDATLVNFDNATGANLTINGAATANGFTTSGQTNLAGTGSLSNTGASGFTYGGGSVTTITANATLDIGSVNALVSGGLVTNYGNFGAVGRSVVVDFAGRVQGPGTFLGPVVTQNGGVYSPGNSPGPATHNSFPINGGGVFDFEIANATGTAGNVNGWDMATVMPIPQSPSSATIALTATPLNKYSILLTSRLNDGSGQTAGPAANFNPAQNYAWKFIDGSHPTTAVTGTFNAAAFSVVTSGFQNSFTGSFSVELRDSGQSLYVVYTAPVLAPTVSSITPVIGPTTGGTLVTILGANFVSITSVTFGGIAATFSVISTSEINATTASHSAGAVDVVVANASGAGSLAGGSDFTYAVPAVSSVVVNGGPNATLGATGATASLAGQHSVVKQILVTFNQPVTVASDAFTVTPRTQNVTVRGGAAPSANAATTSVTMISSSVYLVTFVNDSSDPTPSTHGGGLLNSGIYDLTTIASKVTANGQPLAADRVTSFFAMFGTVDANNSFTNPIPPNSIGDGLSRAFVDPGSLFQFSDAFGASATAPAGPPAYNVVFDSNLDGFIDPGDLFAFSDAFGIDWSF